MHERHPEVNTRIHRLVSPMQSLFPDGHDLPSKFIIRRSFWPPGMFLTVGARHPCLALIDNTRRKDYQNCGATRSIVVHTWRKNMKKYVLLGVIALVMLLAVPAVMASDTASLTGSGILDINTITVSTTSSSFDMGQLKVGEDNPFTSTAGVTVAVEGGTPGNWKVDVSAVPASGWTTGHMNDNDGLGSIYKELNQPMQIRNWGGAYEYLTSTREFISSSGVNTGYTRYPEVKQPINGLDVEGTYTITLTFTGYFTV